jgi:uroporphyrinogen-III decarboxylase
MPLLDYMPLIITTGMSFSSDWFFHNAGTRYDEATMRDPRARFEMDQAQGRFIRARYPEYFGPLEGYRPTPSIGIGVATVPSIWGCPVLFQDHMNPFALPLLGEGDDPMQLRSPDLGDRAQWLLEEIDVYHEMGFAKGSIGLGDLQGPLNVAMKLVGDERMLGLIARPAKRAVVEHILDVSTQTYIDIYKLLRGATGRPLTQDLSVSGCTYYYLGPKQWLTYILPVLDRVEELGRLRLHHCGLADTRKIETYAQYPRWTSVEFGFGSDLKRARELFQSEESGPLSISCRFSPYRMLNQTAEQVYQDVNTIIEGARRGPMSIACVGVPWQTPEANIRAMWQAVEDYHKAQDDDDDE